ncbi:hypothetical protein [Aporhodopirellula aestuarii]|uniref:Lipoprotein n=1 Tax=Aporhodopirellula aestuarii TaxID=2950107 RepID=A0ABT0U666_9BACT|nr:hypothetical protein [Aporhodopirellula aestuarii]MCM2372433.1 hypothetical protein [Aporhodopirellula aestuarii]
MRLTKLIFTALTIGVASLGFGLTGCDNGGGSESKAKTDGFELNWGSGSVKIDGDGGVDVQAPGVDVKRKAGEGVIVRTDNVDVDVAPGNGVQVKTPDTAVDASLQRGVNVNSPGVQVETRWNEPAPESNR